MISADKDRLPSVSRRHILWGGALAACGAVALTAAAQPGAAQAATRKMSQKQVSYQPSPKGPSLCRKCSLFQPPTDCKFVEGPVAAIGWCSLYTPK